MYARGSWSRGPSERTKSCHSAESRCASASGAWAGDQWTPVRTASAEHTLSRTAVAPAVKPGTTITTAALPKLNMSARAGTIGDRTADQASARFRSRRRKQEINHLGDYNEAMRQATWGCARATTASSSPPKRRHGARVRPADLGQRMATAEKDTALPLTSHLVCGMMPNETS